MSISSYRRNVKKGVTGPYLTTCFPASLDQICPEAGIRSKTYKDYLGFVDWYYDLNATKREKHIDYYDEMLDTVAYDLGGLSCQDLVFKHACTPRGMRQIVSKLLSEDYRVAVDICTQHSIIHTVGLLPTDEPGFVTLVSNQIPKYLSGVQHIGEVCNRMEINYNPATREHPTKNANIVALPPAA